MTEKSHVIYRKKSKITDFFKKREQFVTLKAPAAVQVISPKSTQPNQDQDAKPQ